MLESKLLNNPEIEKIFHYARADMAHIKHYLKVDIENVQCTKLQSKIIRSYSDSHSLKTLIKEFINFLKSILTFLKLQALMHLIFVY